MGMKEKRGSYTSVGKMRERNVLQEKERGEGKHARQAGRQGGGEENQGKSVWMLIFPSRQ